VKDLTCVALRGPATGILRFHVLTHDEVLKAHAMGYRFPKGIVMVMDNTGCVTLEGPAVEELW
jgi:hypothetical protein